MTAGIRVLDEVSGVREGGHSGSQHTWGMSRQLCLIHLWLCCLHLVEELTQGVQQGVVVLGAKHLVGGRGVEGGGRGARVDLVCVFKGWQAGIGRVG